MKEETSSSNIFYYSQEIHDRLQQIAEATGCSIEHQIAIAIQAFAENNRGNKGNIHAEYSPEIGAKVLKAVRTDTPWPLPNKAGE